MSSEAPVPIPVATVHLRWTEPWKGPPAPHLLRGAMAAAFPDNDLFHQHDGGRLIYRYPRIHYRWEEGEGVLVGFGDGAAPLAELFHEDISLRLGAREVRVAEARISFRRATIKPAEHLRRYFFRSPWLALNQENHSAYKSATASERRALLDRMAVANLLAACKGLGHQVDHRLYAAFQSKRRLSCRYKDQTLTGFTGTLLCNLDLPEGLAIGRAVSHGYGWLQAVEMPQHRRGDTS